MLDVAAWVLLGELLKEADRSALALRRISANYWLFLSTRTTIGFAFLNGLCWVGIFAFLSASPFVFVQYYGVRADHYGFYFALLAVTLVVGAGTNKRLLRRHPGRRVLRWGCAILILGGICVIVVPMMPWSGPLTVMIAVMVYCFGQTLVMPNAVAAALEPLKHMAGTGSALLGIVQMLCGALGGYVVNALYDGTPWPMGIVILGSGLACSAIYAALLRTPALKPAE